MKMPELPEVETVRSGLSPLICQAKIEGLIVRQPRLRYPINTAQLQDKLIGQTILNLRRRAKYLLLDCHQGSLLIHLGMTGVLRAVPQNTPIEKHDHLDILLNNSKMIRFKDTRRFGAVLWVNEPDDHPLLNHLGEEPLSPEFNPECLAKKLRHTGRAIKLALMDQQIVVGVGNIYANEALFMAGIHPQQEANTLKFSQIECLVTAVKTILHQAILQGGTSLKDFLNAEGQPGYFKQTLQVYGRKDQACLQCQHPICKMVIGQRATYFCTQCQDLLG
jgi:formamidopyrimidine-DNA glycosylase